jgi:hypothetical protein
VTAKARLEAELREWLRNHHGVISWHEAQRLGASEKLIRVKLATGEWARMHHGVYRNTAVPQTPYQAIRGAFVATRGAGVVSHRSAGWMWHLLPTPPSPPELTVPAAPGQARRPQGITIHRLADLDPTRAVSRHSVLVTNPLRTVVDLATSLPPAELTAAIDTAVATRLLTIKGLTAELDRLSRPGRCGVGLLRWHLHDRGFLGAPEASVLEAKTIRLIASAGLPLPMCELHVGEDGEYRLDFAWPDIMLSVEVDGYVWHFTPEHQQRDLARRNRLQDAGWTLRVYTWRDVCHEPARVATQVVATHRRLTQAAPETEPAAGTPAAKSSTI